MDKVCLVFIFNHRFERNISKLDEYYCSRFATRRYLMPFGSLANPSIIPVVENGYTFSGHIAQGAKSYISPDITHYVFLGDDLILNGRLTGENLIASLGLEVDQAWIKSLTAADPIRYRWHSSVNAAFDLLRPGFDYAAELPPAAEAQARFEALGMHFGLPHPTAAQWLWALKRSKAVPFWFMRLLAMRNRPALYPLLAGYSDFVVVPASAISDFVRYCGVFAAMNMFAEIAVPTALALASTNIKTELVAGDHFAFADARHNPQAPMHGFEMWDGAGDAFAQEMNYDFSRLINEFPEGRIYAHPIKLSKWK